MSSINNEVISPLRNERSVILWKPSTWFSINTVYNEMKLDECETEMLKCLKTPFQRYYITLPNKNAKVWTLATNQANAERKVPIVWVHGFCGALAMWIQNIGFFKFHF